MKIRIDDLSKVINVLLSNLSDSLGNEIDISNDFYWDISEEQLYNPYEKPNDLSLGQISDDLNEVNRLCVNDRDVVPYDIKRVAEILKALSIENPIAF